MATSRTADDVLAADLLDPDFRAVWEATAVARALALWLVRYRAAQGMEVGGLASRLGVAVDAVACLEAGDADPPIATLLWLSRTLGTTIDLEVRRGSAGDAAERLVVDATAKAA